MRKKLVSVAKRVARKIKNTAFGHSPSSEPTQPTPEPTPQMKTQPNPPEQASSVAQTAPQTAPSSSAKPPEDSAEKDQIHTSNIDVEPIETPNPNAYKFKVDTTVAKVSFSVASLEEANDNSLAQALIQLDGISSIFGVHDFVTITKTNSGDWDDLIPQVTKLIQLHLSK